MLSGKLIRDYLKIDEKDSHLVETLGPIAYIKALREKVVEEATEVRDARTRDNLVEELADLTEVINTLRDHYKIAPAAVEKVRVAKYKAIGGFKWQRFLNEPEEPTAFSLMSDGDLATYVKRRKEVGDLLADGAMKERDRRLKVKEPKGEANNGNANIYV